ncbi:acetylpolyamine aminohydrolase [Herbaspirillum rubrisubalbicans]|jgi:acetoin utilization deacetylase AcuC-like enzyme|uniref:Acetylpolyamine aminohydrolase n=2 Tax=Herbaspirillum rubrisubalbicans TaxID=80842 RepID=A0ABX9C458_9BURK|nr:histone deacetylase family protein [Herbaspirillum rubrisubalbicans]MCP1576349.1 acetoin utilization deacetylase AcuC-like enzyme [Herbaspirillum rubrisubalbicans]QJP99591.1 histone deacetylase family protein [Herbaspirillum rubrisubalbicans Os34]RAM65265.1 acetylpolyamine aminohydrolase [Herbaspirillum rubrisubalbicans]RAN48896.1 acetylpolyamine aminohydrolase [Herbaspirillum rubrisubalbicans]
MKTFYHPEQKLHHPQSYYSRGKMRVPQEVPERLDQLAALATRLGFEVQPPPDTGAAAIGAVHALDYLQFLQEAHAQWMALPEDWGPEVISNIFVRQPNALRGVLAKAARYLADGSCPVGPQTWHSAYWSAQCAIAGAQALLDGQPRAYALCRPPGHHARRDAAGGFCYLNNAAIAAQMLSERYSRVLVLDTDMHHGQGIQEIFYTRRDVMYVSIHGDPENFYPVVAGFEDERGSGEGHGYNLNLPMPHGAPEAVFFERLAQACRAITLYQPEVLVLSLGFDIFEDDPQSVVGVSTAGFERLGREVAALGLPTLVVQEGGYHIAGLQANAERFFAGLEPC